MKSKLFGKEFKKILIDKDISQLDLAEKVNLSSSHISDMVRGVKFNSPITLKNICKKLNISDEIYLHLYYLIMLDMFFNRGKIIIDSSCLNNSQITYILSKLARDIENSYHGK
jgi:transcriptional regulator with XRE-family HTH domain